jgi:hypothetical protein|nr:MAG TPA: hypothetical protein [Caudoviricetes sp.]
MGVWFFVACFKFCKAIIAYITVDVNVFSYKTLVFT